jgi:deazaflavin-dependent oxidoreductase (nitroreductase family)
MPELTRYAKRSTIRLTTKGRKSGQPRTVTIWFVVTGPQQIEVQHVRAPVAQWYKNLVANPAVQVDFGDGPLPARAAPITDAAGIQGVLQRIRDKHPVMGPLVQWLGRKAEPVAARIEIES